MDKHIINSELIHDYSILTDTGFKDVIALHETIPYIVYELQTKNSILRCADNHILFLDDYTEIFVKDLKVGHVIKTIICDDEVVSIKSLKYEENMFDFELKDDDCNRYYTNDILSHNTHFIRSLLRDLIKMGKFIIYLPPALVDSMTDPSMMNFLSSTIMDKASEGKSCVLLLEDAESLLVSRSSETRSNGITNLLNITDGLLNDMLSIQVIATFNTELKNIDEALLRPERLIARKEFKKLKKEDAQELATLLDIKTVIDKDSTLAEIYSKSKDREVLIHEYNNEKKKIGFK